MAHNLSYGALQAAAEAVAPGEAYTIVPSGTDLIATLEDGTVVAYNPGDIAWILCCSALVLMMIPGLGFLYSGLVRRKNALTLLLLSMLSLSILSFQWFFWGYSLTFSEGGGPFIGNLHHFALMDVMEKPISQTNNKLPAIVYCIYQNMFASLVAAVFIGAAAERGRLLPACIFMFCWGTVVYDPIARWVWSPAGWAWDLGVLDYAGGGPIEICSGVTGLVYSMYLGKRRGWGTEKLAYKPHNVSHIIIGTVFLWFGWLGFNGGSTFAANVKAGLAILNTNLAASVAGVTWMVLDYRLERKWSAVGFCSGAIVGLVAITAAAGYVGAPASIFIGFIAAVISNFLTQLKSWFSFDDAMDIYACHGVAGIVGLVFTGAFAQANLTRNDAYSEIPGGWLNGNWRQMGLQFAWICATWSYTFVVSYLLMFIIDHIPGCHFRSTEQEEILGMDEADLGEWAYDYAQLRRNVEDHIHGDDKLFSTRSRSIFVENGGAVPGKDDRLSEKASAPTSAGATTHVRSGSEEADRARELSDMEERMQRDGVNETVGRQRL